MRLTFFVLALLPVAIVSLPFPKPVPEQIFPCTSPTDINCGKEGSCTLNKHKTDLKASKITNSTYVCVCTDKYGTLSVDDKPCTRERVSKALAFWMQLFFGWLGVGAFILHWWWYALSVYLALLIGLLCVCGTCLCKEADEKNPYLECMTSCVSCVLGIVLLAMWVTNLVFIITDCYSVVDVGGKEYSFQCWENL